ncbi:MAG: type I restriction enzyme HsdR N-terminal domain-containing protein [Chitinophagales bacterium]|nr:type I restriction enzyme HsdR N-terminal domain-containing protein [Chitinophagales bacterium]HAE35601.1 restriction endonuclease subunit R [Bacteroidota bacterium]MCB9022288.1 type I restriction enzyme HsdR N-terminal domain-containing protein [Chitinophagales bacterium]HPE98655.1 type I restriction enzyme HsdR N-terminal domain-containing protein [Chitinophagales bacterium]HQU77745.1 type I restriction enzyme HsdR N-terminal domain-containing protein [Chitinophagales bacterium]
MQLHFSNYSIRTRSGEKEEVWDIIRRRWVTLTPEEWVRQHLLHYFVHDLHFPAGRVAVEKQVVVNGLKKRTDILLFDQEARPLLLVECKSPDVPLTDQTFRQAAIYNLEWKVPFMMISNGHSHYCAAIDHEAQSFTMLEGLPELA